MYLLPITKCVLIMSLIPQDTLNNKSEEIPMRLTKLETDVGSDKERKSEKNKCLSLENSHFSNQSK